MSFGNLIEYSKLEPAAREVAIKSVTKEWETAFGAGAEVCATDKALHDIAVAAYLERWQPCAYGTRIAFSTIRKRLWSNVPEYFTRMTRQASCD